MFVVTKKNTSIVWSAFFSCFFFFFRRWSDRSQRLWGMYTYFVCTCSQSYGLLLRLRRLNWIISNNIQNTSGTFIESSHIPSRILPPSVQYIRTSTLPMSAYLTPTLSSSSLLFSPLFSPYVLHQAIGVPHSVHAKPRSLLRLLAVG